MTSQFIDEKDQSITDFIEAAFIKHADKPDFFCLG